MESKTFAACQHFFSIKYCTSLTKARPVRWEQETHKEECPVVMATASDKSSGFYQNKKKEIVVLAVLFCFLYLCNVRFARAIHTKTPPSKVAGGK